MTMTRRNLAVAVPIALAALAAPALLRSARADAGDEAAVKKVVDELRLAIFKQDKAKFVDGVMNRKATVKSLEFPEMTVAVAGPNAIVRHLWVSQSELEGKVTDTKIGVLQVWQKQGSDWKLLARASFKLPEPTKPA